MVKAICTAVSGCGEEELLGRLKDYSSSRGQPIHIFDIGERIRHQARRMLGPQIPEQKIDKKILDLPRSALRQLHAAVFERVFYEIEKDQVTNSIVSTHACFRWNRALMPAFDSYYFREYNPESYFTVFGDVDDIHSALAKHPAWEEKRLDEMDVDVWQQEEILITRLLAGLSRKKFITFHVSHDEEDVFTWLFKPEPQAEPSGRISPHKTIFCTSPSGSYARDYLDRFVQYARGQGEEIELLDLPREVVTVAHEHDSSINENNILRSTETRRKELDQWRAEAMRRLVRKRKPLGPCLVLSHVCFRYWEKLLPAFDPKLEVTHWELLSPDIFVTLIDNILATKVRLSSYLEWPSLDPSLRELTIWRDEETFATRAIAEILGKPHYIIPIQEPFETLFNLIIRQVTREYLSFPITEILKRPKKEKDHYFEVLKKLRRKMRKFMVVYDPFDLKDSLLFRLINKKRTKLPYKLEGHLVEGDVARVDDETRIQAKDLTVEAHQSGFIVAGTTVRFTDDELEKLAAYIGDQIVERDFRLIDQSDIVVVYYPVPHVSPGVMAELNYGYSHGRDTFILWRSKKVSPFLRFFSTTKEPFTSQVKLVKHLWELYGKR